MRLSWNTYVHICPRTASACVGGLIYIRCQDFRKHFCIFQFLMYISFNSLHCIFKFVKLKMNILLLLWTCKMLISGFLKILPISVFSIIDNNHTISCIMKIFTWLPSLCCFQPTRTFNLITFSCLISARPKWLYMEQLIFIVTTFSYFLLKKWSYNLIVEHLKLPAQLQIVWIGLNNSPPLRSN